MTDTPPQVQLNTSPKTLALIAGGGLLAGTLIVVGAILPAEYNVDPLGLGKLSGIARLWAPAEKEYDGSTTPAFTGATTIQHHTFEIPLGASDWPEAALEYKFMMKPGQAYLYTWKVEASAGSTAELKPIEVDFHGHTLAADGKEMTVAEYKKTTALTDTGSLSAPFEGIHGWYWKNTNADPVTVKLEVWGFYELVPPGQPGNEFRVNPLPEGAPPG